jgi:hypothetical protein
VSTRARILATGAHESVRAIDAFEIDHGIDVGSRTVFAQAICFLGVVAGCATWNNVTA